MVEIIKYGDISFAVVDKYKPYLNTNGFIYTPININQGEVIFLK